jgi:hypothetical protein
MTFSTENMMIVSGPLVDPRTDPKPPAATSAIPPTDDPNTIRELIEFCQAGRIYAVEAWIRAGRPLQAQHYQVGERKTWASPIQIALDLGNHDLALLLLCNGYDLRLEQFSPLERILRQRRPDLVNLLTNWGDDVARIWPEEIFDTYDGDFIELCWARGVDYTRDGMLAQYLGQHANKPLLGWAKRRAGDERIQQQLGSALRKALWDNRERAVHLLIWAGADPMMPVGDVRWNHGGIDEDELVAPIVDIVSTRHGKLLHLLDLSDARIDLDALCDAICDREAARVLVPLRPSNDWSKAIVHNLQYMQFDSMREWRDASQGCLEELGRQGTRLANFETHQIAELRRTMLKSSDSEAVRFCVRWMQDPQRCEPSIYNELVRTPSMSKLLIELGLKKRPRR